MRIKNLTLPDGTSVTDITAFLRALMTSNCLKLGTAQQNKVSIVLDRHSGNLLAGIHKSFLDTG